MKRFTIAVLVKNQFGVLNRVTSMFRRRQFNITSLTVSETETPEFSRITVLSEGEDNTKNQLIDQLYKLPDVCSIQELKGENTVSRELLLIKLKNNPAAREDIKAAADAFGVQTVDYTKESMVLQMTGKSRKIDAFIEIMRDYEIMEICRTGVVSLERGESTIRNTVKL